MRRRSLHRDSRRGTPRRSASALASDGSPDPASARVPWSGLEIVSPHDPEARFSHKPGKVEWVGYKDHQTETCDEEQPNLIVHVVTTPAPEQDIGVVGGIHAALAEQHLALKKPGGGLPPVRLPEVIGRRLKCALAADMPLREEDLEH